MAVCAWVDDPNVGFRFLRENPAKTKTHTEEQEWSDREGCYINIPKLKIDWRDTDKLFTDTMTIHDIYSSPNSYTGHVTWKNSNGAKYEMECKDFLKMTTQTTIILGQVIGYWKVRRSGRYNWLVFAGAAS